jgi:hypothetical protein
MFFINGHGCSISHAHHTETETPVEITLKPNQYVVMKCVAAPLVGAERLQDVIWKETVYADTPIKFIQSLTKLQDSRGSIFCSFGSSTTTVQCPNLALGADTSALLDDRFGIFSVPISINNEIYQKLRRNVESGTTKIREGHEFRLIAKSPTLHKFRNRNELWTDRDNDQYFLLNEQEKIFEGNTLTFPDYTGQNEYLHTFIEKLGNSPFIIFCNLCRTQERGQRYTPQPESDTLDKLITMISSAEPASAASAAPQASAVISSAASAQASVVAKQEPAVVVAEPAPAAPFGLHVLNPGAKSFVPGEGFKNKYLKYKNKYMHLKKLLF